MYSLRILAVIYEKKNTLKLQILFYYNNSTRILT